ncbi:MAG: biotin/lipoyl-binding protein [Alphaproteobacteria bacterium]|nr:MAG: biotin/lipoyl-binding protein [Alphaproteobacteria bacterium]
MFKVLRIKPTAYVIAAMIVAGVFMIGGVVVVWTQAAPITDKMVTSQYVVQLVPYVKGQVKAIYAQALQPMKKGELLLEIDPAPYEYTVKQVEAQLATSKANVKQAEAALATANAAVPNSQANLDKAKAADELAKTQEQIALNIQRADKAAISQLNVAKATQEREQADAAVQQAVAGVVQAQASAQQAAAAVQVAQSSVPAVEAQLQDARFNLAQCKMLAPGDGYVVNWQVQIGTMLVPAPIAAAGTFVNVSDTAVAAVFPQNWLANVEPGNDVEMVLNPYPGRLFLGKVDYVIAATGGGQFTTSGTIPNAARIGSDGLYAVRINFTDRAVASKLSLGSGGSATIYTNKGKATHVISKVAIRMKKWLLYVMPSVEKPS